jgi:hypothetical protein
MRPGCDLQIAWQVDRHADCPFSSPIYVGRAFHIGLLMRDAIEPTRSGVGTPAAMGPDPSGFEPSGFEANG